MSNLEKDPVETTVGPSACAALEVLEPREVPLGGPRALTVRRTLPQRSRSLIGPWCFADHYGPDPVDAPGAMNVPPHPHTGLQTVSWLFAGEIEHRDSTGAVALIHPGQVNLMTAGRGIQHSEVSTAATDTLHGVQLWLALPDASRHVAPFFEHDEPAPVAVGDAVLRVFAGSLVGSTARVTTYSPLVGAQLDLSAGRSVDLPVDPGFEHGLLIDSGTPRLLGTPIAAAHLGVTPVGLDTLRIEAGDQAVRAVLIGGAPFRESIVMWWNFVGRSHDEVAAFRQQWQAEVIAGIDPSGHFGSVDGYPGAALPAPELPNVRLRPRD
ncbi:MAG: pirin family protein [Pseudolysinimonas sp.]|jgi:redox-sensitive bicupin YhaK (pirin superfamily)|uniref:pirin family protein n=1 Tax=Pseudolysinimonas sp. TaxID=2680009 RepID=UPI003C724896